MNTKHRDPSIPFVVELASAQGVVFNQSSQSLTIVVVSTSAPGQAAGHARGLVSSLTHSSPLFAIPSVAIAIVY